MSVTVYIALIGWIPFILILFAILPPRRAVLTAFVLGWLFLPMAGLKVPGIPDYSKVTATNFGVLLGVMLFDSRRLTSFRPRWVDLPMLIWCVCSYVSSIVNGLGAYDGMSAMVSKILLWGIPYFIGRIYLTDLKALREAAVAMFVGGLIYAPLCLLEMKISPQLHKMVYGYFQDDFSETLRFGGYRPTVFMQHGLMVAMWMGSASLAGLWLWQSRSLKKLWGMPTGYLVAFLMITSVLCRSVNATILLMLGIAVLYATRSLRSRVFVIGLAMIAPMYLFLRINGIMTGQGLVSLTTDLVGKERAESLAFRLNNEDLLLGKSMQQPIFGWGGWNRYRVVDDDGITRGITDGMWVIAIGENGLVGLSAITIALLLPGLLLTRRLTPRMWDDPLAAGAAVLAVVVTLHMIDNLPNGMFNPVYVLAAGGVTALTKRKIVAELEDDALDHLGVGGPGVMFPAPASYEEWTPAAYS